MGLRDFVIPDIHGCAETFRRLVEERLQLRKTDRIYLLGDIIDRGPRSKEALDFILDLAGQGYAIHCIRGNHEQMLLDACESPADFRAWVINGGYATLDSFGINKAPEIPVRYLDFIRQLPLYIEIDEFILVHAGLNFEEADPFADTWSMLWSRTEKADRRKIGNRRLICGHTPHSVETIRRSLTKEGMVITLDNGCVYHDKQGLGSLAALELNSMELTFQENVD